jgi:hypothetical protein
MPLQATLKAEMLKKAMDELLRQWSSTAANKRRHGEASPMTEPAKVLKGRFKAWARLVFGDLLILQSIVLTGQYSSSQLRKVSQIRASVQEQTKIARVIAPQSGDAKEHQNNRKWMKWLENQLRSRRVPLPGRSHPVTGSVNGSGTSSGLKCSGCPRSSDSTCRLCSRPSCRSCMRGGVCLNTGACKNLRTPPETMGKGKGSGKGMTTQELLERYQDMANKVDAYVDLTGRGRRTDGTWGSGALAARGAMWLTTPEMQATGTCGVCRWYSPSNGTPLYRCHYCHTELCIGCCQWVAGMCRCSGGCSQPRRL